ncbi:MAG: RDD family protein [Chloroflexi bacterium AL-W]|nr:RDD family protein [Chloroflexi bacterium AL-N1]NOK68301.1 RDD family protein [Chloroflexi bacterium AL-N10]NOK73947.1 RDD family protein [Chloroflexi bacterium AL-N5]NOK82915.1 RDD family protein [Chloroflexi bacterium AL-W]NOK90437.1 RDD family protein [Chloroflexi bacterium AL-N15]
MLIFRRIAAYSIDILILFSILGPLSLLMVWLLGTPQEGLAIWRAAVLSFSLPAWSYFILSHQSRRGATPGKRLLNVFVSDIAGQRISLGRAFARTAIKLLPWELTHMVLVFATNSQQFTVPQQTLLIMANLLLVIYLAVVFLTRGRRSVHDFIADTLVGIR